MERLEALVRISVDIAAARNSQDRYLRILEAVRRVIPYDAAALLRLDGDCLIPLAGIGLSATAMGRRYAIREHPRLEIISKAEGPFRFPIDTRMPDPFDGLIEGDPTATQRVHACLGVPLRVHGNLVGALTADAFDPRSFDCIDPHFLTALGALAAGEVHTTELIEALERTAERHGRVARDLMRDSLGHNARTLVGAGRAMTHLRQELALVGRSDLAVLITGETGTGKELVARAVQAASGRADQPMIHLNCAALPEALAESELFGHVRGAFTGANADRPGKFEIADGGTLFLDEVGELPLSIQPKLLRVLQEGEIQRVGADRTTRVDVRVLAATNRDLPAEVAAGRFRADLYHRLAVFPLFVPPLRERPEDVPLLAGYFCDMARRRLGIGPVRVDAGAVEVLASLPWPGNVRELDNVISRVVLRASAEVPRGDAIVLTREHFRTEHLATGGALPVPRAPRGGVAGLPIRQAVEELQRDLIRSALDQHGGNWAAAARTLGLDRGNLHHLAQRLGVKRAGQAFRLPG